MKWKFACATAIGLTSLSIAMGAVPSDPSSPSLKMRVTDDTALYQRLSEIRGVSKSRLDFDGDIERLSSLEPRYRERLPSIAQDPRLAGPMKRISSQRYRAKKRVVRQ